MTNFYQDVICKAPCFHSPAACHDLALLEPFTRGAVMSIIAAADQLGKKLIPTETYRSVERQQYLYSKHLTELRQVGVHHYGLACDLALTTPQGQDPKGDDYLFLRTLAEQHGMISGIDWGQPTIAHSFRDYDHVQRIAISRQAALFNGSWYPDLAYAPLADLGRTIVTAMNAPLIISEG